jgi:GT2 family glycosyltransferase
MNQIEISVVIPTYHRNDLLAKCLDCLAPEIQTLPADQYEIIVTDDGSQTTAEEMIREHYPWVKWVAGPRKGPAANRNHGAKYARGEFIAFTDDDCLPSPSWLWAFSSALTPDIHVYEGKTTCEAGIHSPLEHAPINLTGGWLWSCNMMIRASLFQKLNGFDENFPYPHMEDTDLRERLKMKGYYFLFVENAVVDHPPRELPWGDRLGAYQESVVYYWKCKKKQNFSQIKFLKEIAIFRLKNILSYQSSLASFKAVISMFVELVYVIFHIKSWKKKYSVSK